MSKAGVVSISGNPNVGKSTLLNAILGQKLAIVSSRPQTTRGIIRGIYNSVGLQVLFVDNPGFLSPRNKLDEFMFKQARESIHKANLIYLVVEPEKPDESFVKKITGSLVKENRPVFLVINKVDRLPKEELLPIIETYQSYYPFKQIIPISALNGDNIGVLLKETEKYMPEGEPFYPQDMVSDQYERYFVAELIREKLFHFTHQEVPYSTAVKIEDFKPRDVGKWFIRATIVVEKSTHKGIIIGKGGLLLRKIGRTARKDIEDFLGQQCYLELFVKVVKDWKTNKYHLRDLGYSN